MRYLFGDLISDWTFTTAAAGEVQNLAQLVGGVEITFWSERIGGVQFTDLRDMADQPITSVTSSTGSDNRAVGQIPMFWGPEGVTELWAQAGPDGPRARMVPVNTAALLTEHMNDPTLHQGIGGNDPAKGAPGVLYVVAAGASETEQARAHFICDGTDDHEQIQAAIEQLRAGRGGRVLLSGGLFYLGAPIDLNGLDDVDLEQELYLTGMGPSATQLVAGAGLPAAIRLVARRPSGSQAGPPMSRAAGSPEARTPAICATTSSSTGLRLRGGTGSATWPPSPHETSAGRMRFACLPGGSCAAATAVAASAPMSDGCFTLRVHPCSHSASGSISDSSGASYCLW